MKITTLLRVNATAPIIAGALVGAAFVWAAAQIDGTIAEWKRVERLSGRVFELSELLHAFSRPSQQARAFSQWQRAHDQIATIIDELKDRPDEADSIGRLTVHHRRFGDLTKKLIGLIEAEKTAGAAAGTSAVLRDRIEGELMIVAGEMLALAESQKGRMHARIIAAVNDAGLAIGVAFLLLIVAVPASSIAVGRRINSGLKALKAGVATIEKGDLGFRLDLPREDELSDLAKSINSMTDRLQSSLVSRDELAREVDERKHAQKELKKASRELATKAKELETANKELEAFAYSVSHDLRAPLRSIDGFSHALVEDYADKLDGDGKDMLGRVRDATVRMGHLIDDILKLSRVTRAPLQTQEVDLSAMASEIVNGLRENDQDRDVQIDIAPHVTARCDPQLMRAALTNLLDNAWKYTARQPKAKIEFGQAKANGKASIYVRDNGAGFDMAYADKLFKPFQRLHSGNEFAGTGIGLATVARIIHRHGGQITAESRLGEGATFTFEV